MAPMQPPKTITTGTSQLERLWNLQPQLPQIIQMPGAHDANLQVNHRLLVDIHWEKKICDLPTMWKLCV